MSLKSVWVRKLETMILQLNAYDSTLKLSDFLHFYSQFTSEIHSRTE